MRRAKSDKSLGEKKVWELIRRIGGLKETTVYLN